MFLLLLLFSSCKGGSQSNSNTTSSEDVAFETIAQGLHSNYDDKTEKIITSRLGLEKVYARMNRSKVPGEIPPEVDFTQKTVVFLTIGQLSTGGFTVEVDRIKDTESERVIYVGGTSPKPGENVTMALTSPFTMISFEKTELPIRFEYKRK